MKERKNLHTMSKRLQRYPQYLSPQKKYPRVRKRRRRRTLTRQKLMLRLFQKEGAKAPEVCRVRRKANEVQSKLRGRPLGTKEERKRNRRIRGAIQ